MSSTNPTANKNADGKRLHHGRLVLTRKAGSSFTIGDDIKIEVVEIKGGQVKIGITAPPELEIERDDLKKRPM